MNTERPAGHPHSPGAARRAIADILARHSGYGPEALRQALSAQGITVSRQRVHQIVQAIRKSEARSAA
jgi:hypothetical protein